MTTFQKYFIFIVTGFCILFSEPASSQFITIARKIKAKHTKEADVATVILDAKPDRVYQAVLDTLNSSAKFKINQRNNAARTVEFQTGTNTVTLQVDSLAVDVSQIKATAPHSDTSSEPATALAVKAITAVCIKLGVKYTVEKE
jgi:hypothetical protein